MTNGTPENTELAGMWPSDGPSATALNDLGALLRAKNACALVGAGLLVANGFPSWGALLDELALLLPSDTPAQTRNLLARYEDVLWRAQEYRKFITESPYSDYLESRFSQEPVKFSADLLDTLRLNVKHVFTTNYDKTLERAQTNLTGAAPKILDWSDARQVRKFLAELQSGTLARHFIHLHGTCDKPSSMVLTYSDYVHTYLESNAMVERLFVLLATQHFVFLGYSLTDPDFAEILRRVNSRLAASNPATDAAKGSVSTHYAILAAPSEENLAVERRRLNGKFAVEPIFYKNESGENHKNLGVILERLLRLQESPAEAARASAVSPFLAASAENPADSLDPQKGKWGGMSARNGRALQSSVSEEPKVPGWFRVKLEVFSLAGSKPLEGQVTFHLHDSFDPPVVRIPVDDGKAILSMHAYGAFTFGVECADGTLLEQDLAQVETFPEKFRNA